MGKKIDAVAIAKWFLCNIDLASGDLITHLKLQKLVYYAQAWYLALNDKELFPEEIEAWAHGPVVPCIFQAFKGNGFDPIPCPSDCPVFDKEITSHLSEILDVYGIYEAKYLERLTHQEAPWLLARGNLPIEVSSHNIISKESMKDFYKKMNEENKSA